MKYRHGGAAAATAHAAATAAAAAAPEVTFKPLLAFLALLTR